MTGVGLVVPIMGIDAIELMVAAIEARRCGAMEELKAGRRADDVEGGYMVRKR